MINSDNVRKEKIKEPDSNWSNIPDDLYRLIIIGGFRIWKKTNSLFNLISNPPDIDKTYLYATNKIRSKISIAN